MKRHGENRGYSTRCHASRDRVASAAAVTPAPASTLEVEPEEAAPITIIRISDSIVLIAVSGVVVAVAGPG